MINIVHRRIGPVIIGVVLTLALGSQALARDIKTSAQFNVSVGAIRAGIFWLDGSTSPRAYTVSGGFRATGLIGGIANVAVALSARGTIRNGEFQPVRYTEDVTVGRRSGVLTMDYKRGTPTVDGKKFDGRSDPGTIDPALKKDSLDPLSSAFALLRTQPLDQACQMNRYQFDGERRTQIIMNTLTRDGEDWVCTGQFLRLKGYSERDLRRNRSVEVFVRYAQVGDDLIATKAEFTSTRGVLRLTRR